MNMFCKKRVAPLEDQPDEEDDKIVQAERDEKRKLFFQSLRKFLRSGLGMYLVFVTLWFVLSLSFIVYGLQWSKPNE